MNRAFWILLLAGLSAFSTGCGSARKARKARKMEAVRKADSVAAVQRRIDSLLTRTGNAGATQRADTVETAALDPGKASAPAFLLALHGRTTPFQTFSGKARMAYESDGKSQEFTAIFRIRRDSAIWISIVAVGGLVPVARVLITPDSVLAVSYLQREAYKMPLAEAGRLLPLPAQFAQLQSLLLGDVLARGAAITSTGRTESQDVYYVATQDSAASYNAFYNAADRTLLGEQMKAANGAVSTDLLYKNYAPSAPRSFAMEREINIEISGEEAVALHALTMSFTDPPRFDVPLEFPFSIPKNYTLK